MNKTINKFLLAGDNFMPELHLRQTGVIYTACGPFTKHRERIQKFIKIVNLKHIYKNELDKDYFANDAACFDSKDLTNRTILDRILIDRAYKIAITSEYCGCQKGLTGMVHIFLTKNRIGSNSDK